MTCLEVRAQLAAYLAEGLGEEERRRWRSHVTGCNACRRWVWQEDPAVALALSLPPLEPGDDRFADEVLAGIRQRRVERALTRKGRLLRAAAAAVLVASILGYLRWTKVEGPTVVATPAAPAAAPEPFVEVEGEGVRVYQLASGSDVQVAFIVSPSVEL